MIENIINDLLSQMSEKEKEDFFILCLSNKKIYNHLSNSCNKEIKNEKS